MLLNECNRLYATVHEARLLLTFDLRLPTNQPDSRHWRGDVGSSQFVGKLVIHIAVMSLICAHRDDDVA